MCISWYTPRLNNSRSVVRRRNERAGRVVITPIPGRRIVFRNKDVEGCIVDGHDMTCRRGI